MGAAASKNAAAEPSPASACPAAPPPSSAAASTPTTTTTFTGPAYDVYARRIDKQDTSASASSSSSSSSSCPVLEDARTGGLDPRNNMPRSPSQEPCAGQRLPLSTSRAASSIPKAGVAFVVVASPESGGGGGGGAGGGGEKKETIDTSTDVTWTYPSPQMFFNALRRKGKGADVSERDMESVVSAHNAMNEATWRRVAAWERALHAEDSAPCGGPRLARFLGRPHDLSPAARMEYYWSSVAGRIGGSSEDGDKAPSPPRLPFDRHDWYVDRCGREVRYVIDFYFDEARAGTPEAFDLRVRPALDSPGAALDRLKMLVYEKCAEHGLPCPVTGRASGRVASEMAEAAGGRGGVGNGNGGK